MGKSVRQREGDLLTSLKFALAEFEEFFGRFQQPEDVILRVAVEQIGIVENKGLSTGVDPLGIDAVFEKVADDQQGRVAQSAPVGQQLGVGSIQVDMLAFIFPGEMVFVPDIGATPPAGGFLHIFLEGEKFALRVKLGGSWIIHQLTEFVKVALCGLVFPQGTLRPTVYKIARCNHGQSGSLVVVDHGVSYPTP